jgi:hypothetical protein
MTDTANKKDMYAKIDAMPAKRLVVKDAFLGESALPEKENLAFSKPFSVKEYKKEIPYAVILFVFALLLALIISWFVFSYIQNANG